MSPLQVVRGPWYSAAVTIALATLLAAPAALAGGFELPQPHLEWGNAAPSSPTPPATAPDEQRQSTTAELSLEERRKIQARLKLRRKMVQAHQVLAFVTAGSIVAADIFGTINETAFEKGTPTRAQLEGSLITHRILVSTALTSYLSAGIIAWTMPKAYQRDMKGKKKKIDSGDVHVALSVMHGVAMGTLVVTGLLQANAATGTAWEALLAVHGISGITAAAGVIGAGIVIGTL